MANSQTREGFEEVFTVTDYYDGPRQGIANFNGSPHYYECAFSEGSDDYVNLYRLTPIEQDLFLLAMEDWAIWRRWEVAYQSGRADIKSHPALPGDRARHLFLESVLGHRLRIDPDNCVMRSAVFTKASEHRAPAGIMADMLVRWSEPDGAPSRIWAD
jgi:hypothetical protein